MARISSFTVFIFVTLILYTILSGGVYAAMTETTFSNPYGGVVKNWALASSFQFSEVHNMTHGAIVDYTDFSPDRRVYWRYSIFYDNFVFYRKGINWWDTWYWYEMAGSPKSTTDVIKDWDSTTNYTKYIFDQSGQFETFCFIYPLCVNTSDIGEGFVYYPMDDSIAHGTVTIVLACNASYYSYDIGMLFGVLTGFYFYGAPTEVAVLIGGIWWVLCLLAIVKLVVG